uniref:Uncharacterized protein n=1 Tax=Rhizophora mucronata TaxID=61149 RepID=A0A2P2Q291_RHIMU
MPSLDLDLLSSSTFHWLLLLSRGEG